MKFYANDVKTWTSTGPEDASLSEKDRTYVSSYIEFDSFQEALEAAKRAAYHSGSKQNVKMILAEINPVIERLETDFSMDPATFNTEK